MLVGRDAELATLQALLDGVRTRGAARVLVGEPGIGKTALLAAAVAMAEAREMLVLSARGVETEQHLAFAALYDLLRPVIGRIGALGPGHQDALLTAFGRSRSPEPPEHFFVALAALELICEVAAERPVLLVVDDLQWLDEASRRAVEFVARRLASEPAIVLATTRPTATVESTAIDPTIERQVLGELNAGDSLTLLRSETPDLPSAVEHRVLVAARGNPLALIELPAVLRGTDGVDMVGPQGELVPMSARLERAFTARLVGFDQEPRLLLLLAAINDGENLSEVMEAATIMVGHPLSSVDIDKVLGLDMLGIDGPAMRFRHPLMRSAVVQSAGNYWRRAAHLALAQALADDPDRRIWHLASAAAGPDEDVAGALDAAAARALERGAPATAATWLEKAAELSTGDGPRARRLLRAGEVAFELGLPDTVGKVLDHVSKLTLDPAEQARLTVLESAFDDGLPGDVDGMRRLVRAAAHARDGGDTELAANLLSGTVLRFYWAELGTDVRAAVMAIADHLPQQPQDPRRLAIDAIADGMRRHRHVIDALAWWSEHGNPDPPVSAMLARVAFVCGEFDRSLYFVTPAVDGLRRQGRLALLCQVLILRTFAGMYVGRWDLTEAAADEAYRLAAETRQTIWRACAVLGKANLAALRGLTADSEALLAEAERAAVLSGNESLLNGVQLSKGLSRLGCADPEGAYQQLRRMMDPSAPAHHPLQSHWAVDYLAEAAADADRIDDARMVLARMEPMLAYTQSLGVHRAARFAYAVLADIDEAEQRFEHAYELAAAASPWYCARLDLAYGTWLRRHRRVAESRTRLQSAHSVFNSLGASAWSVRAARELRAAGIKNDQTATSTTVLSPQEWQIARLAASGLSNRDIAAQLYLSHRTVGSHLYRIYPKLGITSRAQLVAVLPLDDSANSMPS
ncbi:ATP-binding protein [Nocardia tengchongensis]|uniref:ATP-binding protein n=1 Tax=Nocardia tengchongensis TaxID=2055889 RepID=UPI00360BC8BB